MLKLMMHPNSFRLALLLTILVIEFLATTTLEIEVVSGIWDKANHFTAFFVLYVLLSFAYNNLTSVQKFLLLIAYGLQIEIVQSFIDGRYFSLLDVVADSIGILLGALFVALLKKKFRI